MIFKNLSYAIIFLYRSYIMIPFCTLSRRLLLVFKERTAEHKYFIVSQVRVKTVNNVSMKSAGTDAIVLASKVSTVGQLSIIVIRNRVKITNPVSMNL